MANLGGFSISLTVDSGAAALAFYQSAFEAEELYRLALPAEMGGGIAHAEFRIGDQLLYLSEAYPDWSAMPMAGGSMSSSLFGIDVDDCDAAFSRAVEAGAEPLSEPTDQPWGWRTGIVLDPFGYRWNLRQLIEELSPEQIEQRFQAMLSGGA